MLCAHLHDIYYLQETAFGAERAARALGVRGYAPLHHPWGLGQGEDSNTIDTFGGCFFE